MRAWRAHAHGPYREVLRLDEVPDPTPPSGGVVVTIEAAALNFPDLLAIGGTYQVKLAPPFTPGLEAAGTVTAVGAGSRHRVGDKVIVAAPMGAFAERIAVADVQCHRWPEQLGAAEAASLLITYQTGYVALVRRAQLVAGETLLVHGGAGVVGTAAIQIGKALGATVIATAGGDQKVAVCRTAGADHAIDYRSNDFVAAVRELTGGRGADVIYDPVGGDVFDRSLRCLAWEGRILVIGFTSGRIPQIPANRVLLKNISVVGVHWGAYQLHDPTRIPVMHDQLCDLIAAGHCRPLVWRELPLAELPEGLAALENRASHGKIVVVP